eukprot:63794_1
MLIYSVLIIVYVYSFKIVIVSALYSIKCLNLSNVTAKITPPMEDPRLIGLANGNYVFGSYYGAQGMVFGRYYDSDLSPLTDLFLVNGDTNGNYFMVGLFVNGNNVIFVYARSASWYTSFYHKIYDQSGSILQTDTYVGGAPHVNAQGGWNKAEMISNNQYAIVYRNSSKVDIMMMIVDFTSSTIVHHTSIIQDTIYPFGDGYFRERIGGICTDFENHIFSVFFGYNNGSTNVELRRSFSSQTFDPISTVATSSDYSGVYGYICNHLKNSQEMITIDFQEDYIFGTRLSMANPTSILLKKRFYNYTRQNYGHTTSFSKRTLNNLYMVAWSFRYSTALSYVTVIDDNFNVMINQQTGYKLSESPLNVPVSVRAIAPSTLDNSTFVLFQQRYNHSIAYPSWGYYAGFYGYKCALQTTLNPTISPTYMPTNNPTNVPTQTPTAKPTFEPTFNPTNQPTNIPSAATLDPSTTPTINPTAQPSINPTKLPSKYPTLSPTNNPTLSPSDNPSKSPTKSPTNNPTDNPSISPTKYPTKSPSCNPSKAPTKNPSKTPTNNPSKTPTTNPSISPTNNPSVTPTTNPSDSPTNNPSSNPTNIPSAATLDPSTTPTINPTALPSINPTKLPSINPTSGTKNPTLTPSNPTFQPTIHPTNSPSNMPTVPPTNIPTITPSEHPTKTPTFNPTQTTIHPTRVPSKYPTLYPSMNPSNVLSEHKMQSTQSSSPATTAVQDLRAVAGSVNLVDNINLFILVAVSLFVIIIFIVICIMCIIIIKLKRRIETYISKQENKHESDDNLQIENLNHMSVSIKDSVKIHPKQNNNLRNDDNRHDIYSKVSPNENSDSEIEEMYDPVVKNDKKTADIEMEMCNILSQKENYSLRSWFDQRIRISNTHVYYEMFVNNGYETVELIQLLTEDKLKKMGIEKQGHIDKIMLEINKLKYNAPNNQTEGVNANSNEQNNHFVE